MATSIPAQRQFLGTSPQIALAGWVTDAAHLLDKMAKRALEAKLEHVQRATKHQVVVVTAPELGGQDVADYTRELGNAWGIGRARFNDGVILLVALKEHQVRLEVGDGLRRVLPDALCKRIIDTRIMPRFRKGDLTGGIEAGIDAVSMALLQSAR